MEMNNSEQSKGFKSESEEGNVVQSLKLKKLDSFKFDEEDYD